jgi:hypothetical protein
MPANDSSAARRELSTQVRGLVLTGTVRACGLQTRSAKERLFRTSIAFLAVRPGLWREFFEIGAKNQARSTASVIRRSSPFDLAD